MARVAWEKLSYWKKIGSNIGSIRRWRGITDIEVCSKLGMDIKKYRKIEKGQTQDLTLQEIVDIKRFFNVSLEEIVALEL